MPPSQSTDAVSNAREASGGRPSPAPAPPPTARRRLLLLCLPVLLLAPCACAQQDPVDGAAVVAASPTAAPAGTAAAAYVWVPLTAPQKRKAEQLLSIFENSSLQPAYGYAANLNDGRGITFGRCGFCTGTNDGLLVVRKYVELKPDGNTLARFLPALERIDARGGGADVTGLGGFATAVHALGKDPAFRRAQNIWQYSLYYQPSQALARVLGARLALTKAQLYDAYVQHGYADKGDREYTISANGMTDWTNKRMGGSPLEGVDEVAWLKMFLERRKWILENTDREWAESVQRVLIYQWVLELQGQHLDLPINLTLKKCRADGQRGPCTPQPLPDQQLAIGGCIYGNFLVQ